MLSNSHSSMLVPSQHCYKAGVQPSFQKLQLLESLAVHMVGYTYSAGWHNLCIGCLQTQKLHAVQVFTT